MRPTREAVISAARQFPALRRIGPGGRPVVFADAPGGTQVSEGVIEAMGAHLRNGISNTGGAFETSAKVDAGIREARQAAADFLGGRSEEIVFGANATTLLFGLSQALRPLLGPGDEVVVTTLDHDANVTPWVIAAQATGASLRWLDVEAPDCTLDPAALASLVGSRAKVVAFTMASNAVGTVTVAAQLIRVAQEAGAITIVDGVHLAPHILIDVKALNADVLVCSPYKFFGPHLGIMYGREDLLGTWTPNRLTAQSDVVPARWETGTINHEALAAFVACIDYIASLAGEATSRREAIARAMHEIAAHEADLTRSFLTEVARMPRIALYGITDPDRVSERTPTFALRLEGQPARATTTALAERGVFAWDGDFYAPYLLRRLGAAEHGGLVRIGFCHYHALEEVGRVLEELASVAKVVGEP